MDKRFEAPKPVSVGDVLELSIISKGGHGDGIAKIEEFVVFVKGAEKGERCRVKITDVKRTFAVGEKVGNAKVSEQEMDDETEGFRDGPAG
ncbi:MAG: TRAM domain-containing protein [Candidatus Micrarchaeota archaeon]